MTAHRVAKDLSKADLNILDPGASGTIVIDRYGGVCEMESAAAESRTLDDPLSGGLRATVRMRIDGGDITLTASGGLNVAGNTTATFADVGDQLDLISIETATDGTYRWEILTNTGSVALA